MKFTEPKLTKLNLTKLNLTTQVNPEPMNSKEEVESTIEALQRILGNLKVWLAVPMGVMMILYFFSFAVLIDRGMNGLFYFEFISSIVFVMALIYLNAVAYKIIKWRYGKNERFQTILKLFDATTINKPADQISEQVLAASTHPSR